MNKKRKTNKSKRKKKLITIKKRKRNLIIEIINDIDDFVKIVNKVQIDKLSARIYLKDDTIYPVIENILKDSHLSFEKKEGKKMIMYVIRPNLSEIVTDVSVEELEDEFLEEGQLF